MFYCLFYKLYNYAQCVIINLIVRNNAWLTVQKSKAYFNLSPVIVNISAYEHEKIYEFALKGCGQLNLNILYLQSGWTFKKKEK